MIVPTRDALRVVGRNDAEPSVGGLVEPLERSGAVLQRIEQAGADHGAVGAPHRVRHVGHGRVELRVLDQLSVPGLPAVEEGHEHRDRAEQPVPGVFVPGGPDRRIVLARALEADPCVARHHRGEALALHVGTARAPSGRVEVDERRVHGAGLVVAEPQPFRRARPQVVVHDVGPLEQAVHRGREVVVLQVGGDRPLAGLRGEEGPFDAAQRIARHRFELDHVGAEVGEQTRRVRPGVERTEVEDLDAVEERTPIGGPRLELRCETRRGTGELPEDRIGVPADGGCATGHATGGRREFGGRCHLFDRPENGIVDRDHHLVVAGLGSVVRLARLEVLDRAHVGGTQELHPGVARSRCEDAVGLVFQDGDLLGRERQPHVEPALAGRDAIVEPERHHQAAERADRAGVDAEVAVVATEEGPGHQPVGSRSGRTAGGVRFAPQHRQVRERAVEQRRLHVTSPTVVVPAVQRGQDADQREVRGADRREREAFEDRPFAETGLFGHHAEQRVDERFVSGYVAQWTVGAEARDRAVDQPPDCGR